MFNKDIEKNKWFEKINLPKNLLTVWLNNLVILNNLLT